MTVIHEPPNVLERIEHLWAFVSSDEGGEGLCGAPLLGPGSMVPLIAADEARLKSLMPIAEVLSGATGKTIKLVKFSMREDIQVIGGER